LYTHKVYTLLLSSYVVLEGIAHDNKKISEKQKKKMEDIFDNLILCKNCKKTMEQELVTKNGFNLRIMRCKKCNDFVVHPVDKQEYDEFMRLRKKDFEVKMRMVGNSYAVSIPREIVDFMKEQENMINDMVRLNFEEAGRLSLMFNTPEHELEEVNKPHVVHSKEIRIVRNNKPVFHRKEYSDSAHPEKNKIKIFKAKKDSNKELDEEMEADR